jgi:hypothetical protein
VESIKVDVDGLSALSGVCHREAEQLVVGLRDWQEGPNFQATTAAIAQRAAGGLQWTVAAASGRAASDLLLSECSSRLLVV